MEFCDFFEKFTFLTLAVILIVQSEQALAQKVLFLNKHP